MIRVYIAGPMRGYPAYNFPAFDDARDRAKAIGYNPISPADIDREHGVDEHTDPASITHLMVKGFVKRDLDAIQTCDAIAMLPGWEKSTGALAELAVARWLGLDVLDARTFEKLDASILDEAKRITRGDRNEAYGEPLDEHDRIAAFWSTYLGLTVSGEQVAMMMVLLKVARMGHAYRRDNLTDIAGYADCCQRIVEERKRRSA